MEKAAHGRAGGKVILLGEHAVVYGRPALATGIALGVDATLEVGQGPRLVSDEPDDDRGVRLVAEVARAVGLDPSRTIVRVRSALPAGRGLGSSAALCVAVLRAAAAAAKRALTVDDELALGRRFEAIFHGTPSGVDPAAAALGSCFRFVRGEPPDVTPVVPGRPIGLVVGFGERPRSTGSAVGGLRARWETDRARYEGLFDEIGAIVDDGIRAARAGDLAALGTAFDRNQAVLEALGVSSRDVEQLVACARAAGALGAKLTGGGAGGAAIAVGENPEALAAALRRRGVTTLIVDVARETRAA